MLSRLLTTIAAGALLLVPPGGALAQSSADAYHWICFSKSGPLLVRLRVLIEGRPQQAVFAEAQRDYVERTFRYLDADANGSLSPDEAQYAPPPQFQVDSTTMQDPAEFHFAFNFLALDEDRDGGLSAQEMAGFVAGYSDGAVRLQAAATATDDLFEREFGRLLRAGTAGPVAIAELHGLERLLEADVNGDETLSAADFPGQAAEAQQSPARGGAATGELRAFASPRSAAQAAAALLNVYRQPAGPAGSLSKQDIGWSADRFDALDADRSGRLDAAELSAYLAGPADVELVQELSSVGDGPALTLVRAEAPVVARIDASAGVCVIDSPQARIRFDVRQMADGAAVARQAVLEHFADYDADGDGALQADEAASSTMFGPAQAPVDRNRDGAIDAEERDRYLAEFLIPYLRVSACRAAYWTSAPGSGLLDALDADRDRRLARAELRGAAAALDFDRDGNGRLQAAEIPRTYVVVSGPSIADLRRASFDPLLPAEWAARTFGDLPVWFERMDGNADGAVSWREFLGGRGAFEELDVDGDRSIAADEARRAED